MKKSDKKLYTARYCGILKQDLLIFFEQKHKTPNKQNAQITHRKQNQKHNSSMVESLPLQPIHRITILFQRSKTPIHHYSNIFTIQIQPIQPIEEIAILCQMT